MNFYCDVRLMKGLSDKFETVLFNAENEEQLHNIFAEKMEILFPNEYWELLKIRKCE